MGRPRKKKKLLTVYTSEFSHVPEEGMSHMALDQMRKERRGLALPYDDLDIYEKTAMLWIGRWGDSLGDRHSISLEHSHIIHTGSKGTLQTVWLESKGESRKSSLGHGWRAHLEALPGGRVIRVWHSKLGGKVGIVFVVQKEKLAGVGRALRANPGSRMTWESRAKPFPVPWNVVQCGGKEKTMNRPHPHKVEKLNFNDLLGLASDLTRKMDDRELYVATITKLNRELQRRGMACHLRERGNIVALQLKHSYKETFLKGKGKKAPSKVKSITKAVRSPRHDFSKIHRCSCPPDIYSEDGECCS